MQHNFLRRHDIANRATKIRLDSSKCLYLKENDKNVSVQQQKKAFAILDLKQWEYQYEDY
jgi:hypothetical protein